MGKLFAIMMVTMMVIFTFIPLAYLYNNQHQVEDLKQNLNLATKCLANCVDLQEDPLNVFAEGYDAKDPSDIEVKVDKVRLLKEFYDVLYQNYEEDQYFDLLTSRLYIKLLAYHDRFYIATKDNHWSPPYFFTQWSHTLGEEVYVSTMTNKAYHYVGANREIHPISHYGISQEQKNDIIIDKINEVIAQYTRNIRADEKHVEAYALKIQIRNSAKKDATYVREFMNFNILKGCTFMVVYAEDNSIFVNSKHYLYKNYNVTGYTLEKKF